MLHEFTDVVDLVIVTIGRVAKPEAAVLVTEEVKVEVRDVEGHKAES